MAEQDTRTRLTWNKDDFSMSQCAFCVNKRAGATCLAFPNGIPKVILSNEFDHKKPYRGDKGIQFKPRTITEQ